MVEVYYYIPVNEVDNAVECGLKLSKWAEKEVTIDGESRKCISALLNPKDDMEKYKSADYKCVKLELPHKYCFMADRHLYEVGKKSPTVMDMYTGSIIPIENYIFGSYRLPECLVITTVIAGQISILGKRLDSPVLFNNSEELYINNIIESYKEEHDDFNDCLLYNFYCKLAEIGKADKIEDTDNKIAVFIDRARRRAFTIKTPNIYDY
ncbi:MAG: hypothetical protein N3B21_02010 [Clostridia bacterium]|nr:hypothetical protein [Clostridia bacterium]